MIKTEISLEYEFFKNISMYKLNNKDFTLGKYNDKFIQDNFLCFKPVKTKRYSDKNSFCFNYALKTSKLLFCEDTAEYLFDNYKKISLKNLQVKDVIAFADDCNFLHFAVVFKTGKTVNDIIVRSKFGHLNIYEHKLIDTPINFGDRFIIFRKG